MAKLIMFFGWAWLITCIAGSTLHGSYVAANSTVLTSDLTDAATTINVSSTKGFPEPGIIFIEGERITYSSTGATTFTGNLARPLVRGTGGTEAAAHSTGAVVRTREASLINSAMDYDLAVLNDAAGAQMFFAVPVALFDIVFSFGRSPFSFLGTDLEFITYIWGIAFLGLSVTLWIQIAGGRRI